MQLVKPTLVLGASPNSWRYSYIVTEMLQEYGHPVTPYGIRKGTIGKLDIVNDWPDYKFDTITLYLNKTRQEAFYKPILGLKPKRIIFNPGAENLDFYNTATSAGVNCYNACTLVLLRTNQY